MMNAPSRQVANAQPGGSRSARLIMKRDWRRQKQETHKNGRAQALINSTAVAILVASGTLFTLQMRSNP